MGCDVIKKDDVFVVVCTRGRRSQPKKCQFCKLRFTSKLCDFPVEGKTCDAAMCSRCASAVGKNKDYCPDHKDKWDGHPYMPSMQGLQQSCVHGFCGRPKEWHQ